MWNSGEKRRWRNYNPEIQEISKALLINTFADFETSYIFATL